MKFSIASLLALGTTALASSASVCPSTNAHTSGKELQKILDYKKSSHQITAAYFRSWRDIASNKTVNKNALTDLPDCVDIAFVFAEGDEPAAYYTTLKNTYVPTLRARGTKVIRTLGIKLLADKAYTNDAKGYASLAQHLIDTYVTAHGLDGLDIDVEGYLDASQQKQVIGVFGELSKSLGPKSGTDKILIYDTNQDGDTDLFSAVNSYVNYVLVQSYGRSVSSLQGTWDTFSPYIKSSQYLIGFSFYEERGARWGDTTTPMNKSRAYQYAAWQPKGATKGGIFSYATDRDGVKEGSDDLVATDFSWTRSFISQMNP
ncbi:hypothetical protein VHEMI08665 [[Torrubiella] hemipterigena]|uniref:GH18 domain-containing protein n=1 Tax=[Torrubiella] hemipterigena TaxID=1531966 RepID=A0A0A1TNV9_9HYPO|nr:hypothetical protein VHEMI08665 [[Torrubiella] hemipterigena]